MRKLVAAVALASTALATPAFAKKDSWYVGVGAGVMLVEDMVIDINNVNDAGTLNYDTGYDLEGVIGYDFGGFRAEVEVAYKLAAGESIAVQAPGIPGNANGTGSSTGQLDANGDVTTFYAGLGPELAPALYGDGRGLSLGNIRSQSLLAMASSEKLRRIHRDFSASQRACKKACEYYPVCTGGFELTQKQRHGAFNGALTSECVIHVQALVDALLDDIGDHVERSMAHEQMSAVE